MVRLESQQQKPQSLHCWRDKVGCGVATARARAAKQKLEMQRTDAWWGRDPEAKQPPTVLQGPEQSRRGKK